VLLRDSPTEALDDVTPDRPARIDRFSGQQLAGNAPVVCRVPLDALAVGVDEPLHDAEHGPALIKQVLLDLYRICRKY
jgi:hypothetical protein